MSRSEFKASVRLAAWERCKGRCEKCTARLFPGKFAYDHITPDGLGGKPELSNCQVLCDACHAEKTHTEDNPRMIKADAIRKKHLGITKPKHQWPKRKMNGPRVDNTKHLDLDDDLPDGFGETQW